MGNLPPRAWALCLLIVGARGPSGYHVAMPARGPSLIVADGDVSALLACAATSEAGAGQREPAAGARSTSVVWIAQVNDARRTEAARAQAELYELRVMEATPDVFRRSSSRVPGAASAMLLSAAWTAAAEGLESVLWPVHAGEELDLSRVAEAVDRALLVSRLATLDAAAVGQRPMEVRAPYADFTDSQIADLALDMDLPLRMCWWWEGLDEAARRERVRWGRALVGVGWRPPENWGVAGPGVGVVPTASRIVARGGGAA